MLTARPNCCSWRVVCLASCVHKLLPLHAINPLFLHATNPLLYATNPLLWTQLAGLGLHATNPLFGVVDCSDTHRFVDRYL